MSAPTTRFTFHPAAAADNAMGGCGALRVRDACAIVAVLLVAAAVAAPRAAAQPLARDPGRLPSPAVSFPAVQTTLSPGAAFLASAVLPGAGQYALNADRWIPYLVVEAWAVFTFVDQRADAGTFERRYRDLAWSVARRGSTPPRRDSVFEYYEEMGHFSESGAFDV
ncbi:MAG: hypothetical protein ACRELX_09045, partial [Longimicrobiales bacterium]